jgi:hypothetical protein
METYLVWKKEAKEGLHSNQVLLTECGLAALDQKNATEEMEKEALHLLDRVFVLALVVLAIGVLIL